MAKNPCIECSVDSCAYHSDSCDCCALDKIQVGASISSEPTSTENTECCSFKSKS